MRLDWADSKALSNSSSHLIHRDTIAALTLYYHSKRSIGEVSFFDSKRCYGFQFFSTGRGIFTKCKSVSLIKILSSFIGKIFEAGNETSRKSWSGLSGTKLGSGAKRDCKSLKLK